MKSFNVFNEELLQEARKATEGKWEETELRPNHYVRMRGTAGEFVANVIITSDSKTGWSVRGEITNGEGHVVHRIYLVGMKRYKNFETKWKKDAGNFVKGPEKEYFRSVLTKYHDSKTSNFFYVAPPDDD